MGWSTGSELYADLIPHMMQCVEYRQRIALHRAFIHAFSNYDCGTLGDLLDMKNPDPAFVEAWKELFGDPVTGER